MTTKSAAFGLIVGALAVSAVSYADLGDAEGVIIPYAGTLERGGAPVNETLSLRFDLYNSASAASCHTTAPISTDVVGGQFAVRIGPVPEECVAGVPVFLGVTVEDSQGAVTLPGRQRVRPALGAMTSGTGQFATREGINGGNAVGNLHLNANSVGTGADGSIYLNYHEGNAVKFGDGAEQVVATLDSGGNLTANGTVNGARVSNMGFGAAHTGFAHPSLANTSGYAFLAGDSGDAYMNSTGSGATHLRYNNADIMIAGDSFIEMNRPLVVNATISSECRAGFAAVNGGRLCVSDVQPVMAMQTVIPNAIQTCKSLGAHVCAHNEVHEACGAGFNFFAGIGGNAMWLGDIIDDNTFLFTSGSFNTCSASDTSAVANGINGRSVFRCCY